MFNDMDTLVCEMNGMKNKNRAMLMYQEVPKNGSFYLPPCTRKHYIADMSFKYTVVTFLKSPSSSDLSSVKIISLSNFSSNAFSS